MQGYIAYIYPPVGPSSWGALFPDIPGCTSAGDSFEEAYDAAREALSGHLAALNSDGEPVPPARTWEALRNDDEARALAVGAYPTFVVPRRVPGERVRVNITMDKELLRLADEASDAKGWTRSRFIEVALTALLDKG